MPVHCQYKFVAGKKKGTTCDRFLRKGDNQKFCYQHRKVEPEPMLDEHPLGKLESKPMKKTAKQNSPVEQISEESPVREVKQKGKPIASKSKATTVEAKPKVQTQQPAETESEAESSEEVRAVQPIETATLPTKAKSETPKAKVIELSISESSTISSDSTSCTDSSEDNSSFSD